MSKSYNIALLGCGKVARLHARAISEIPHARLAGVWSRTRSSADAFAEEFHTVSYATPTELVRQAAIDLAIVCTPHLFHTAAALEVIAAGAHVLVEKPLAIDPFDLPASVRPGGPGLTAAAADLPDRLTPEERT